MRSCNRQKKEFKGPTLHLVRSTSATWARTTQALRHRTWSCSKSGTREPFQRAWLCRSQPVPFSSALGVSTHQSRRLYSFQRKTCQVSTTAQRNSNVNSQLTTCTSKVLIANKLCRPFPKPSATTLTKRWRSSSSQRVAASSRWFQTSQRTTSTNLQGWCEQQTSKWAQCCLNTIEAKS